MLVDLGMADCWGLGGLIGVSCGLLVAVVRSLLSIIISIIKRWFFHIMIYYMDNTNSIELVIVYYRSPINMHRIQVQCFLKTSGNPI